MPKKQLSFYLKIGLLVIGFIAFVWGFPLIAPNMPVADDFDMFLKNISWGGLLTPHNEHLVFFAKLNALLTHSLSGEINFTLLSFIGFLGLPAFVWLISDNSLIKFSIGLAVLLNSRCVEILLWPSASLTLLWSIVFAIASLKLIQLEKTSLAVISSILSCLSSAAGYPLVPIAAVLLASKRHLLQSIFLISITSVLYFGISPVREESLSLGGLEYFFCLLGAYSSSENLQLASYGGYLLFPLVLFSIYLAPSFKKQVLVYLLSLALVISLSRQQFGIETSISTSRYAFLSLAMIGTAISTIRPNIIPGAFASMVFIVSNYLNYPELLTRTELTKNSQLRWSLFNEGLAHPNQKQAKEMLLKAKDIYSPPIPNPNSRLAAITECPKSISTPTLPVSTEFNHENEKHLYLSGWFFREEASSKLGLKVFLNRDSICYRAEEQFRADAKKVSKLKLNKYILPASGFRFLIEKPDSNKVRYSYYLLEERQNTL